MHIVVKWLKWRNVVLDVRLRWDVRLKVQSEVVLSTMRIEGRFVHAALSYSHRKRAFQTLHWLIISWQVMKPGFSFVTDKRSSKFSCCVLKCVDVTQHEAENNFLALSVIENNRVDAAFTNVMNAGHQIALYSTPRAGKVFHLSMYLHQCPFWGAPWVKSDSSSSCADIIYAHGSLPHLLYKLNHTSDFENAKGVIMRSFF